MDHFADIFNGQREPPNAPIQNLDESEYNEHSEDNGDSEPSLVNSKETKYESSVCSPMTMVELESILDKLPNEKSPGYDQVPGEFLKNSGFQFKKYLLSFYNRIIEEGKVPSELNIGKCCLIWKVC